MNTQNVSPAIADAYARYFDAAQASADADDFTEEKFFGALEYGRVAQIDAAIGLARLSAATMADLVVKAAALAHMTTAPWSGSRLEAARSIVAFSIENDFARLGLTPLPGHSSFDDCQLPSAAAPSARSRFEDAVCGEIATAGAVGAA